MKATTQAALERYVQTGCPVGGFLTAVLQNELYEALASADGENLRDILEIGRYVYWETPRQCWGSRKKLLKWIEQGGLKGRKEPTNGVRTKPADVPA